MRTATFAQPAGFLLAIGAMVMSVAAALPPVVAGPGVPVIINDPSVSGLLVGSTAYRIEQAGFKKAAADRAGRPATRSDDLYWATGLHFGTTLEAAEPLSDGVTTVRWAPVLTRESMGRIRLFDTDGKPITGVGHATPLWLDSIPEGRALLAEAAAWVVSAVKAERTAVSRAVAVAASDPVNRWRASLLVRASGGELLLDDLSPKGAGILARQQEALWSGGIGRLAKADRALAERLSRRLLALAQLPTTSRDGERLVPVWFLPSPGQGVLDTLLSSPQQSLATAITSLLAGEPDQIALVADDAGLRSGGPSGPGTFGGVAATVWVLSLSDRSRLVTLNLGQSGSGAGEPVAALPLRGVSLVGSAFGSAGATSATIKVSDTSITLPVSAIAVAAVPPGLLVGPFQRDWTQASFISQRREDARGIAGSLTPGPQGTWVLYLERRCGPSDNAELERFRVWAGPTGGRAFDLTFGVDGPDARTAESRVTTGRIPSGWCARITLPAEVLGDDGVLRLAVEHRSSDATRTAWPRPMLPWQAEPGRLAIDTHAWDKELR